MSAEATKLRKKLLANGFNPVPLSGKACYIEGWTRQKITDEWLDAFTRKGRYGNTGLRCDNLIAFDVDVPDSRMAALLEDLIESMCGESDFCRVGAAPKTLLLYRASSAEGLRKKCTSKHGEEFRVELLAGPGCQFAAYGTHPTAGRDYTWEGAAPHEVNIDDLPEIDYLVAEQVLEACSELMMREGFPAVSKPLTWGLNSATEYVLHDDFQCEVGGVVLPWSELRDQLDSTGIHGNIVRENGEFGDSDGVHFLLSHGSGEPVAHDFVRDTTYFEMTVPPTAGALMPDPPKKADGDMFTPGFVAELAREWVIVGDGTVRHVDDPLHAYTLKNFAALKAHWQLEEIGPRGGISRKSAVSEWLKSDEALRANYPRLLPTTTERIVSTGHNVSVLNTYLPPVHNTPGGSVDVVLDFVEHLIPCESERELFLDWHALKMAHPDWRMHALLTVTPAFGTGRGSWFGIVEKLLGSAYVKRVDLDDIVGNGSQGEYNEFLADSLLIYVPEALVENEGGHKWANRRAAYEQLKSVIELQAGATHIKRKYGRNTHEMVYCSTLISSNHLDTFVLEQADRRLIVLDNTEEPLAENHPIHEWAESQANITALYQYLLKRAETAQGRYNPFATPPSTPAKLRMIEAGQSDFDRAYDYMLENAKGDIVIPSQWFNWAHKARVEMQLDISTDKMQMALNQVISRRGRRLEGFSGGKVTIQGKKERPWIIRNFDEWRRTTSGADVVAEVVKNEVKTATIESLLGKKKPGP